MIDTYESQIYPGPGFFQTQMLERQWDIGQHWEVGEEVKKLGRWVGRGETQSTVG